MMYIYICLQRIQMYFMFLYLFICTNIGLYYYILFLFCDFAIYIVFYYIEEDIDIF